MVLLPQGGDQAEVASAAVRARFAIEAGSPDTVGFDLERLWDDERYVEAADSLRRQIETMPSPAALLHDLIRR